MKTMIDINYLINSHFLKMFYEFICFRDIFFIQTIEIISSQTAKNKGINFDKKCVILNFAAFRSLFLFTNETRRKISKNVSKEDG